MIGLRKNNKNISVPSQTQNIDNVVSELVDFVEKTINIDQVTISLVLTEAVANAMIHGNKSDPAKKVFARVMIKPEQIVFKVTDEGLGFDYQRLADPTKQENLHKQNGRGIFFIRHFMDEVRFNTTGNEITMIKYVN